ncbi:hypothetical protein HMI56_007206 [Coelomomyces lativittatus]|nr:hypothetical protein HMI56_007206 [Coelomomyces lativittatus]
MKIVEIVIIGLAMLLSLMEGGSNFNHAPKEHPMVAEIKMEGRTVFPTTDLAAYEFGMFFFFFFFFKYKEKEREKKKFFCYCTMRKAWLLASIKFQMIFIFFNEILFLLLPI